MPNETRKFNVSMEAVEALKDMSKEVKECGEQICKAKEMLNFAYTTYEGSLGAHEKEIKALIDEMLQQYKDDDNTSKGVNRLALKLHRVAKAREDYINRKF